jgi:toxin FitB
LSFLLDTNVVSEWTRPVPDERVVAWLRGSDSKDSFLSVATWAELKRGVHNLDDGGRKERLDRWLRFDMVAKFGDRLIGVDRIIAERWGEVSAAARRNGVTLPAIDGFIAATALVRDMTVVTRNTKHFDPLGVKTFNPWAAA